MLHPVRNIVCNRRALGRIGLAMAGLFASGCATMVSGTTQRVTIASVPEGASFTVHRATPRNPDEGVIAADAVVLPEDGSVASALTPAEVVLRRDHDYVVRFQKAGYAESALPLCRTRNGNPWVFGNLVFPLGLVVDVNSAAQHELDSGVNATLEPGVDGKPPNKSELICRRRSVR